MDMDDPIKKKFKGFPKFGENWKNSFHREREFLRLIWRFLRLKLISIRESLSVQSLRSPVSRFWRLANRDASSVVVAL